MVTGRMHVVLNGEPLEEVDCFKYQGSQVSVDGRKAWGALKTVLINRLGIKAQKCLYEGVIVPTAL